MDAPSARRRAGLLFRHARKADVAGPALRPAELLLALASPRDLDRAEREIAAQLGIAEALLFVTARGALVAALEALGRPATVAVAGYTTSAVPNAVVSAGGRPLFVDVDDRGLVPAGAWPTADAVITQDSYGFPAPIPEGRTVVRDATHGAHLLTADPGVAVAVAGTHESKWLATGQGAIAVTDDRQVAARMRAARDRRPSPPEGALRHWATTATALLRGRLWWHGHKSATLRHLERRLSPQRLAQQTAAEEAGAGADPRLLGRPHRYVARLAVEQTRRIPELARERAAIVARYDRAAGVDRLALPLVRYPMLVEDLGAFEAAMRARGWAVDQRWLERPLLPRPADPAPFGFDPAAVPNARRLAAHVACLPTHRLVSERDADDLIASALALGARPVA